ncbi:MAG TPA: glycosyltransferase family 4 protein [Phycisphaerales bacterium]|nr:glycosyltransferase family 4 protein [Phycisphaerales bacterium]
MSTPRKILFVCQVFYPDTTSTSQLFTSMFAEMVKEGHDITALCAFPSGREGRGRKLPRFEVYKGIKIRRLGFRIDHKKSHYSRAMSYLGFMIPALLRLLFVPKPTIVFGVTNPPFLAQGLYLISLLRGLKYQYMVLDAYPESLIALGMSERSFVARAWTWLNKLAYRRAEKMIVLGRDMTTMLVNRYGIDEKKSIVYIPHWSAVEAPDPLPVEKSAMIDRLGLRGKFIVQYSGNMGMWHDMDSFVRAAKQVEDDPSIHFLFIGEGARRTAAVRLAEELGCTNITWHDFVPLEQVRESLSSCHAALISLRAGFEGIAVPSKLYGILMSGRAVLAQTPIESETAYTLAECDCGVTVAPGDTDGLVRAIREMAANRERTAEMGRRAFRAYKEKYTQAQAIEAFSDLWGLDMKKRPAPSHAAAETAA